MQVSVFHSIEMVAPNCSLTSNVIRHFTPLCSSVVRKVFSALLASPGGKKQTSHQLLGQLLSLDTAVGSSPLAAPGHIWMHQTKALVLSSPRRSGHRRGVSCPAIPSLLLDIHNSASSLKSQNKTRRGKNT